ncbi:MAG: TetR/AcrR family transcriptional regulator [Spirochaetes bacterium]|nr:TetR/AcrR family transcriptional regulator [Spirochaetota bacterium]
MSKRAEILQLANLELQQKGVASLSFRELAAKLGIKSSSVHYYFAQKDDLIEALIDDYSKQTLQAANASTQSLRPGKERLLALVDLIHDKLQNRQCTAGILAAESAQISERARAAISAFFNQLEQWLINELKAAGKKPAEAQVLARVILTSVEGSLMIGSVDADESYLQNLRKFIAGL